MDECNQWLNDKTIKKIVFMQKCNNSKNVFMNALIKCG